LAGDGVADKEVGGAGQGSEGGDGGDEGHGWWGAWRVGVGEVPVARSFCSRLTSDQYQPMIMPTVGFEFFECIISSLSMPPNITQFQSLVKQSDRILFVYFDSRKYISSQLNSFSNSG